MQLNIPAYELKEMFLTRKQLLDMIVKYCIKVAKKSVIGHKLLCIQANDDQEEGFKLKEDRYKVKKILGIEL